MKEWPPEQRASYSGLRAEPKVETCAGRVAGADCDRTLRSGAGDAAWGMRRTIGARFLVRLAVEPSVDEAVLGAVARCDAEPPPP